MNPDQRKALIDAMLALGTIARAMPLGELYEAIERDEKVTRTRDGRWTQSLIQSMRWLTDVSGELERVRSESQPVPYTLAMAEARQCEAWAGGPGAHKHQCQKVLINDADHIGQHICTCGHTWVVAPSGRESRCCVLLTEDGDDHTHMCVRSSGHLTTRQTEHRCKCGQFWSVPGELDPGPSKIDIPDDWFMPGTN